MKATSLLEKQHAKVRTLFKKLEGGRGDAAALREELADNLCAHMAIEQDIFYPAVRRVDPDLVGESYEEHAVAELSLKRLLATATDADTFKARVTMLKELIEHHVEEEEEDLFPKVDKALGAELETLGQQMKQAFEAALAKGYRSALPKKFEATTSDAANKRSGSRRPTPLRAGRTAKQAARRPR